MEKILVLCKIYTPVQNSNLPFNFSKILLNIVVPTQNDDENGGVEIVIGQEVKVLLRVDLDVGSGSDQENTSCKEMGIVNKILIIFFPRSKSLKTFLQSRLISFKRHTRDTFSWGIKYRKTTQLQTLNLNWNTKKLCSYLIVLNFPAKEKNIS